MLQDWDIQRRGESCSVTGRLFAEGEEFWSALYWKDGEYQRIDYCEEAWQQRNDNIQPLSVWKTLFQLPPPAAPEPLKKDDAESLLRKLMEENDPSYRNARYILALMLERKRLLRPIDRKSTGDEVVIIYEHLPSGETWIIPDPQLRLDQLEPVQDEVAALLGGKLPSVSAPASAAEPKPESEPAPAPETAS